MHCANNVMCPSLRELISSSGSWWVLKGLRVHSKFIVGLPAPMGQSTNGWPWGLAAPDLRRSCLTTSVPPGWPRPSLPLASTFNSLIFDQIIKQTPAFRCTDRMEWGRGGGTLSEYSNLCGCVLRQYPSRRGRLHLSGSPAGPRLSLCIFISLSSVLVLNASRLDLKMEHPNGALLLLMNLNTIYTYTMEVHVHTTYINM